MVEVGFKLFVHPDYGPHHSTEGVPLGIVQQINVPGHSPLQVGSPAWEETLQPAGQLVVPLPEKSANAIHPYWQHHGHDAVQRNCHTYAHIVGALLPADIPPSKNLTTNHLLVSEADRQQLVTPSNLAEVQAGDVLATMSSDQETSPHTMVALGIGSVVMEVNAQGGRVVIAELDLGSPGYGGTHVVKMSNPTPALGTSYWQDRSLTPSDDRPTWYICQQESAAALQAQASENTNAPGRRLFGWVPALRRKTSRSA